MKTFGHFGFTYFALLFCIGIGCRKNCDGEEIPASQLTKILKELTSLRETVEELQKNLNEIEANQKSQRVYGDNQVPIGFIYFQLPQQFSPDTIWPNATWTEVTSEYAGLFFRAEGGQSAQFGLTQEDSTRQITQMENSYAPFTVGFPNPISIPLIGWSDYGHVGHYSKDADYSEGLRLFISDAEVRPRNTAIRVWKRSA